MASLTGDAFLPGEAFLAGAVFFARVAGVRAMETPDAGNQDIRKFCGMREGEPCCIDRANDTVIPISVVAHAIRTHSGRPSSSIRFSARTAMPTSVARRASVRDRSASPPWPSWLWIAAEHTASAISEENSLAIEASVR